MSNYRFKFPELYQFFGGYFYQGWSADYRWENARPNFSAVVRHFKAVNPPATVTRVRIELKDAARRPVGRLEIDASANAAVVLATFDGGGTPVALVTLQRDGTARPGACSEPGAIGGALST